MGNSSLFCPGTRRLPAGLGSVVCAALCLAIAVQTPANASTARLLALGGDGAYFEDESNVNRWYGSLGDYPDRGRFDSGVFDQYDGYPGDPVRNFSGPSAAMHLGLGETGSLGTLAAAFHFGHAQNSSAGTLYPDYLDSALQLVYCLEIGKTQVAVAWRNAQNDIARLPGSVDNLYHSSNQVDNDFGAGVRLDLTSSAYLDLAAEIRINSVSRFTTADSVRHDRGTIDSSGSYALRARSFIQLGPILALVPLLEHLHEDRPSGAGLADRQVSGRLWRLGCALNVLPDTDTLMVLSVDYRDSRGTDHRDFFGTTSVYENQRRSWQLRAGFETRVLAWLTVRGAFAYEHSTVLFDRLDDPFASNSDTIRPLPVSLGFGVHLFDFDLDGTLSSEPPRAYAGTRVRWPGESDSTWMNLGLTYRF